MPIGRSAECGALDRLLEGGRAGRSGALVLRGEPGVGKTTLLDYAGEQAGDFRVLRGTGIENESERKVFMKLGIASRGELAQLELAEVAT